MRTPNSACLLLSLLFHHALARLHSLPEDPHAFPKFKVAFLNNLPVLNETAQKWLLEGIPGGELEFLDQPWDNPSSQSPISRKEIDSGDFDATASYTPVSSQSSASYSLEHMKMGPRDSYLCLVPKALDLPPPPSENSNDEVATLAHSWSLLQPLTGTCLYHRQGWFTYSYCHNDQIRQFKELMQVHSHIPEEDNSWDSYTLGKAPANSEPGADLTVAERNALEANLELARGAGSRYLVQRWGDGTMCDKTGKGREVEVQFHCSMAMSDTVLFVKETKTCSYVLVINTPRLCGEPGFRSYRDVGEQAHIRCREIVNNDSHDFHDVPESDHPQKIPRTKHDLPATAQSSDKLGGAGGGSKGESSYDKILLKTIEAFFNGKAHLQDRQAIVQKLTEDGDFMIEFVDDILADGDGDGDVHAAEPELDRLTNLLRAAGLDIKGVKGSKQPEADGPNGNDEKNADGEDTAKGSSTEKQQRVGDESGHLQVRNEL